MKVEVIKKYVDYLGSRGAVRDIPKNEAEVHIRIGNAKKYVEPQQVEKVEPAKPRRRYRRRDMKAEIVAEEPKEESKSEVETTQTENTD
jgi:hypothetical protein